MQFGEKENAELMQTRQKIGLNQEKRAESKRKMSLWNHRAENEPQIPFTL